jgi:hypothetical protein
MTKLIVAFQKLLKAPENVSLLGVYYPNIIYLRNLDVFSCFQIMDANSWPARFSRRGGWTRHVA